MAIQNGNLHAEGENDDRDAPNLAHSGPADDERLDDQSPVEEVPLAVPITDGPAIQRRNVNAHSVGKSYDLYAGDPANNGEADDEKLDDQSPIEQVALTVPTTDDPDLPVWTFRVWFLGLLSSGILSFLNQFFDYHTQPLFVSSVTVQVLALPIGQLMAAWLPKERFRVPFTKWTFTLNPGRFNIKEHVLITLFSNGGGYYPGGGPAYAVYIVSIVRAFYHRHMSFVPALLLVVCTQMLGYGWAGLLRRYLVEPAHMWWPSNLVQVSVFQVLHEKERVKGLTRTKFFLTVLVGAFVWATFPGYLVPTLVSLSVACLIWPNSVRAQQIGSGVKGLGIGAFSLDWAAIQSYFGSPLVYPLHTMANMAVGFFIFVYIMTPLAYWTNTWHAKNFPLCTSHLFTLDGQPYDTEKLLTRNLRLDEEQYGTQGPPYLGIMFALGYGVAFASTPSTFVHVFLFHGKEIWERSKASFAGKPDVHTRLMRKYDPVPESWFQVILILTTALAILATVVYKSTLQMPFWCVILAIFLSASFTLPFGVLQATTNTAPGLNVLSEYMIGYWLPNQPLTNVCFKAYSTISVSHALSFLQDMKLGHYMKIPPKALFFVQATSTVVCAIINLGVATWLLDSVEGICDTEYLGSHPESPWTCPYETVFFSASVIWGLVGPKRIFGPKGAYRAVNWGFLIGLVLPFPIYLAHRKWPKQEWIKYIVIPVLCVGAGNVPPAGAVNFLAWLVVGTVFTFYMFRYQKAWWSRYNYVLSAGLDAGTAFFQILVYFSLNFGAITLKWWGSGTSPAGDHCPLAICPTTPGIRVPGCPYVYSTVVADAPSFAIV